MTTAQLWSNCLPILPEIILSATICLVVLADMLVPIGKSRFVCGLIAFVGTLVALNIVMTPPQFVAAGLDNTFGDMIVIDSLSKFFRMVFLAGGAISVLFAIGSVETIHYRQGEFLSLILGATLGACLLVSSNNFLMFVLSLETLSLCSYVLAAFIKHQRLSAEAGLKYLLYGALASGVMIFGISYLYGMTGTIKISDVMATVIMQSTLGGLSVIPFLLALVFVLAGLGFKMAMVPFQSWAPDVYQGAPTPVTAFLSVVSKAAGFAALLRVMFPFFGGSTIASGKMLEDMVAAAHLPALFAVLAVVTMTFGNLVALRQTDVKRLLAYSSIAHAGYLLMGMTVYNAESYRAIMFYLFMYLVMNLGAFWVVIVVMNRVGGSSLSHFRGLAYRNWKLAAAMFIFLISLTGIPPTAGFVAKLILFKVVINAGITSMAGAAMTPDAWFYFTLAFIGVINSAVSLVYYMKIMRAMAFERPENSAPLGLSWTETSCAMIFAVATIALLNFGPILNMVNTL